MTTGALPAQAAHGYPAPAITVAMGANVGDPIGPADVVEPGDIYRLAPHTEPPRLTFSPAPAPRAVPVLAAVTRVGAAGHRSAFGSPDTFLAPARRRRGPPLVRASASGGA